MRKYPLPTEIRRSLERDLKMRPLIRYVANVKAANTIPPSYMVFLHNGQSFQLYIEQTSIVAKIGPKSYWLMNGDETAEAIKAMNRVLTQPIPTSGNAEDEDTKSGDTGEADAEMEPEAGEDEGGEEEA